MRGRVKSYHAINGYGFIIPEDRAGDVFVHQSEVREPLRSGDVVEFDVLRTVKGRQALRVRKVSPLARPKGA